MWAIIKVKKFPTPVKMSANEYVRTQAKKLPNSSPSKTSKLDKKH